LDRHFVSDSITQRPTVVKIGGSTLGSGDTTLEDVVSMQKQGYAPVIVHGGGKVISQWMERSGAAPKFVRGMRVTDQPTLDIVVAVLTGLVNKQLVASMQALGGKAIGLSGVDGGILQATTLDPELGYVGKIVAVNPNPVRELLETGWIPIIAPVATGYIGEGVESEALYNINGDVAAGELAAALDAGRLIYLTDVEGVMDASKRTIPRLVPEQARALIESKIAAGGMIPKLEACLNALPKVGSAQILDGRRAHALMECLDGKANGTRVG
jgi:acetylglutamate kinase